MKQPEVFFDGIPINRLYATERQPGVDDVGEILDFVRALGLAGLAPRCGTLVPAHSDFRYFRIGPEKQTRVSVGSALRSERSKMGYRAEALSGERSEHAGTRPEGMGASQAIARDRLGDELRKCALSPKAAAKPRT